MVIPTAILSAGDGPKLAGRALALALPVSPALWADQREAVHQLAFHALGETVSECEHTDNRMPRA
jgi:hypothetical protein